jgi:hypothetical protein
MPVELKFAGDNGNQCVNEMFVFIGSMQTNLGIATGEQAPLPSTPAPATKAAEAAKGKGKAAAKAAPAESKFTLQDAIDTSKKLAVESKEESKEAHADVMKRLTALNVKHGIAKVRELPPEKIDLYMADLQEEFAAEIGEDAGEGDAGSMFD